MLRNDGGRMDRTLLVCFNWYVYNFWTFYCMLHCMYGFMLLLLCFFLYLRHINSVLEDINTYPYRNDKVVTRLWSPCNLVTTLLQPCHNLATTLSQPCSLFTIPLQPCSHIVYSFTRLSQACHNLATTLS